MTTIRRRAAALAAAALTLAALAAGPATAGDTHELDVTAVPAEPVEAAQEPETGATQEGTQTDEDDEELGEEIPEEEDKSSGEEQPPGEGGSTSSPGGGTPRDDSPPTTSSSTSGLPRTGRDPLPLLLFGSGLLFLGLGLRGAVESRR